MPNKNHRAKLLIVDDDPALGRTLKNSLKLDGYEVRLATTGAEALAVLASQPQGFDMALVDVRLPDADGTELVGQLRDLRPDLPCAVFTAYGTVATAVAAMQRGAFDFILKPFPREKLLATIERGLERSRLLAENRSLREKLDQALLPDSEESLSPDYRKTLGLIRSVAPTDATVLLCGETGTGKERLAALIHRISPASQGPFLSVNCAALTETLLESQLFGHVRGAFTGALEENVGLFERAFGGTLFLDEIGDISPGLQVKLLRVLQEREFLPVGSSTPRRSNARIVTATNRDLRQEVTRGRFREDLYYRLNMFIVEIPPLRRRKVDLDRLAAEFVFESNRKLAKQIRGISPDAMKMLHAHDWPGNIRELKNVVERAAILCGSEWIGVEEIALPEANRISGQEGVIRWPEKVLPLDEIERAYILEVLQRNDWQKNITAEVLAIGRSTLDRKIERYALSPEDAS